MNKISDAIKDIVSHNNFLSFGLQNNLLNLSQTAAYLQPFVEARTKKEVKQSAIVMSLSRIHRDLLTFTDNLTYETPVVSFTIKTNLCSLTYFNNSKFRQQLNEFYPKLHGQKYYFVQSQGVTEYEIVIEESLRPIFQASVTEPIMNIKENLVSIDVQMLEESYERAGTLSHLLQQIAFQGIVVYSASSTYTEFIFNVEHKDLKLTVETLCALNNSCLVGNIG